MKSTLTLLTLGSLLLVGGLAHAGPPAKEKIVVEPEPDQWEFTIGVPAWIAGVRGDTGINGSTAHANTGFGEIVNKLDLVGAIRAEAGKGKFGILTEFSYLSLSDGVGIKESVISKLDVRQDQIIAELGARWRILDTPRGWIDVIGGVRYTYLYEEFNLNPNDARIDEVSTRLAVANALVRARTVRDVASSVDRTQGALRVQAGASQARRTDATLRVVRNTRSNRDQISRALSKAASSRVSRTDQWYDPFVGVRGHYKVNDSLYLLGRFDISPFDIGADFAWQASAGFGWKLSPRLYTEVVYRILDVEYRHDGLTYDNTSHGPEITVGLRF